MNYRQRLKTPRQRLEEKFVRSLGCWEWTGALDSNGYGQMHFEGRVRKAHAISKHLYDGFPIDSNRLGSGLEWDHLCRNHKCVRPEHLELVAKKVNIRRGASPIAKNAAKTHCPNGHELSGKNLLNKEKGYRSCRKCHYKRTTRYRIEARTTK